VTDSNRRETGGIVPTRTVELVGRARASFEADGIDVPTGRARSCATVRHARVRIAGGAFTVPVRMAACGGHLSVTPVSAGLLAPRRSA
jgi:hypothetical protein